MNDASFPALVYHFHYMSPSQYSTLERITISLISLAAFTLVVRSSGCGDFERYCWSKKKALLFSKGGPVISDKHMQAKEITRNRKQRGGFSRGAQYLLKRWLFTLILVLDLKSSGSSITGTGTWLRSLICAWSASVQLMKASSHRPIERERRREPWSSARTYRVIDPPHQDAQHGVTGSENLHFLLHEVFLLRLPFGRQGAQRVGGGAGRGHRGLSQLCVRVSASVSRVCNLRRPVYVK